MLPHGYLLPQVVAVVLARPLAQRDMWGRHSRSLGDRRARLRGVREGVFLVGGIRRAYPQVGEGRTWRGRAVIITIIITIIIIAIAAIITTIIIANTSTAAAAAGCCCCCLLLLLLLLLCCCCCCWWLVAAAAAGDW